jgi:hypothetical protein
MGIPRDMPFYAILGAAVIFSIHDAYRWTLHKASKAYDYVEDRVDDVSDFIATASDDLLYQTGLSATSHIPRTFPSFQNLPVEIRCQIWKLALSGPRVISLRTNCSPKMTSMPDVESMSITSVCRIPPMLHVCRESREGALKIYGLSFGTEEAPPKVYIDFTRDTVLIGSIQIFSDIKTMHISSGNDHLGQGFEKVRIVALRLEGFIGVTNFLFDVCRELIDVVLVNERRFELGPEPNLKIEGFGKPLPVVYNNTRDLVKWLQIRKEHHPNWKVPLLSKGRFEKGKKDRWYCEGRGRSKFG